MRWLALLATLIATQASALSCLAPDPVRTFKEVDASPDRWGAVVGRLDFNELDMPIPRENDPNSAPPETYIRAQLVGHSLGPDGFRKPFQASVVLNVQCFGPWCARPSSGQTYLAFIKREPTRHVAFADPCGTKLFPTPSREDLDRLQDCFNSGPCEERAPAD